MGNEGREKPAKAVVDSDSDSSDDEDYVPDDKVDVQSAGEDSSDDSDREQDTNDNDDDNKSHNNKKRYRTGSQEQSQTATSSTTRSGKRRHNGPSHDESAFNKKPRAEDAIDHAQAESRKSRLDALWAEMNAPVPKASSRPELMAATAWSTGSGTGHSSEVGSSSQLSSSSRMVTITTTYDFAGEMVTVTKDVAEDSKEAKEFALKNKTPGSLPVNSLPSSSSPSSSVPSASISASASSKDTRNDTPQTSELPTASSSSTNRISTAPRVTTRPSILDSLAKKSPVRYVRKKSNLDALAATYGVKKPAKLNTLEKSKLDWKNFVGKEGIEDELKHHNKDGYMEKVAFLQRTDERRDQTYQELKKRY